MLMRNKYRRSGANNELRRLPVPAEVHGVVPLPGAPTRGALDVLRPLAVATVRLAGGGKATQLAVLHHRVHNPVDPRVPPDGLVLRVNEDDLVVFVGRVLGNPVRVEHPEGAALASGTLLSLGAEGPLELKLFDTFATRLAVANTLGDRPFPPTTLDSHTVDDVALLGLVSETASLVRPRRPRGPVDRRQLTVLPRPDPEKEPKHIRLLPLIELLEILVGTHD